jgi:hypothetical protein
MREAGRDEAARAGRQAFLTAKSAKNAKVRRVEQGASGAASRFSPVFSLRSEFTRRGGRSLRLDKPPPNTEAWHDGTGLRFGAAAGPRAVGRSLAPGAARVFHILWITFQHGISDPRKHGF